MLEERINESIISICHKKLAMALQHAGFKYPILIVYFLDSFDALISGITEVYIKCISVIK